MESLDRIIEAFSNENVARLTSTQANIYEMERDIDRKKVELEKAEKVNQMINGFEKQIKKLESSTDYLSPQEMREFQMEICFQETQIENLTSVQDQLQFAQKSCSILEAFKEEVLVSW